MRYLEIITEGSMMAAASTNVERHLGDVAAGLEHMAEVRSEVWTLAHDGVINAGGSPETATRIANMIAAEY